MRPAFFLLAFVVACTQQMERTSAIQIPVDASPCTFGARCAEGADVDPSHDHLADWRALPCHTSCELLLGARKRSIDLLDGDAGGPFWIEDEGSVRPKSIDACEPIRADASAWVVTCTYVYDQDLAASPELL